MNMGKVRISNQLIADALQFPLNWKIIKISPYYISELDQSEMLISGKEFPEANNSKIENVKLVLHQKYTDYEVVPVEQ